MFFKTVYIISWFGDRENIELVNYRKELHNNQIKWILKNFDNHVKVIILAQFYNPDEFYKHPRIEYIINNDILLTPNLARNKLKEHFYKSDEDYCLFLDNDIILDKNFIKTIKEYKTEILYNLYTQNVGVLSLKYYTYSSTNNTTEIQFIYSFFGYSEGLYIFRNFKKLDDKEFYYDSEHNLMQNCDMSIRLFLSGFNVYYYTPLIMIESQPKENSTLTDARKLYKDVIRKKITDKWNKIFNTNINFSDLIPYINNSKFDIVSTPYIINIKKGKITNYFFNNKKQLTSEINEIKENNIKNYKLKIDNSKKMIKKQRVNQIYVSTAVSHFKKQLLEKYKLNNYNDINEPSIFNGLYNKFDLDAIKNHKGKKIIVWCGNDANKLSTTKRFLEDIKKLNDTNHIAKSIFIQKSLSSVGIVSELLPITPTTAKKNVELLGKEVYFYGKLEKHGAKYINEIQKKIPFKIIHIDSPTKLSKKELYEIYKNCFIGVRLTTHDGLSNTVIELGLMGRRCVHNSDLPNTIPWKNLDDVVDAIMKESKRDNSDNEIIADSIVEYLDINDDWLYI